MAIGICNQVYPCDDAGDNKPITSPETRQIYFGLDDTVTSPPQDQLDLKRDIENALRVLRRLFPVDEAGEVKFRPPYVQLVRLAQIGLLGQNAMPEIAKRALDGLSSDLIQDEGGRIKNTHLFRLSKAALTSSAIFGLAYVILRLAGPSADVSQLLLKLSIDWRALSCFMVLWIGCSWGVVLSYGMRTTTMTVNDLVNIDADLLLPSVRVMYAGMLTMVFGIILYLAVVELKLGGVVSTLDIGSKPILAFLIGVFCGISELSLPGAVSKKTSELLKF